MAIIRITEDVYNNDELLGALVNFFETMDLIDTDEYRKTRDFYVTGEGIPIGPQVLTVYVYDDSGIKPFVIEVE